MLKISRSLHSVSSKHHCHEDSSRLGWDAVTSSGRFPTFRRLVAPIRQGRATQEELFSSWVARSYRKREYDPLKRQEMAIEWHGVKNREGCEKLKTYFVVKYICKVSAGCRNKNWQPARRIVQYSITNTKPTCCPHVCKLLQSNMEIIIY